MCREIISAAQLEQPVTVLGVSQVQAKFPGLSLEAALDAYEAQHRDELEEDSGRVGGEGAVTTRVVALAVGRGMCIPEYRGQHGASRQFAVRCLT